MKIFWTTVDVLVINTHRGLFRYDHLLLYGVSVAPAMFQSFMNRMLHNLPVTCYLGDILISALTVEEHNLLVEKVLQ